jgi:hypothetical protein
MQTDMDAAAPVTARRWYRGDIRRTYKVFPVGSYRERASHRRRSSRLLLGPQKKNRDAYAMANPSGRRPEEEVGEESVPVSAHGNQVTAFLFNPFDDLVRGLAVRQFGLCGNSGGLKLRPNFLQIGGIFGDLRTHSIRPVGSGGPSVGDMKQNEAAVRQLRKLFYVLDDGPVTRSAVQRHQNGVIHSFRFSRPVGELSKYLVPPQALPASNNLPRRFQRIRQPIHVHGGDQNSTGPTCDQQKPAIFPISHSLPGTGELQQWKHGERKLQRQNDLTERQQVSHTAVASHSDDQHGRQDGQRPGDEPPYPRHYAPVHKAFHDHLAGKGAGDRAALPACQQRHRKQRAGERRPK